MIYAFGTYDFNLASLELRREGRRIALEPQPAKALALLVAQAGQVVSRDELKRAVWGEETHVDYDRGLAYCIGQVRTALGDAADQPRFVQTLPKRGFRFIAPVTSLDAGTAAARIEVVPATLASGSAGATAAADAEPGRAAGPTSPARPTWRWALAGAAIVVAALASWRLAGSARPVIVAVSIFDNETGDAAYDGFVTGLSDVVVTHLTALAPGRIGVVGNMAVLRQPRNIRNLQTLAQVLDADFVVLGQLQRQDDRLRFIVHFIRLDDGVHLWAERFVRPATEVRAFEADVITQAERAVRTFALPGT